MSLNCFSRSRPHKASSHSTTCKQPSQMSFSRPTRDGSKTSSTPTIAPTTRPTFLMATPTPLHSSFTSLVNPSHRRRAWTPSLKHPRTEARKKINIMCSGKFIFLVDSDPFLAHSKFALLFRFMFCFLAPILISLHSFICVRISDGKYT